MGKVLFLRSSTLDKEVLKKTLSERIDSIFMDIQEGEVQKAIEAGGISLIVIYLRDITEGERTEVSKVLTNILSVPYVLAGPRDDLHKYFVANLQANVLRFIKTQSVCPLF